MAYFSDKKWNKIIEEIYTQWYSESTPNADFNELKDNAFWSENDGRDIPVEECDKDPRKKYCKRIVFEAYFLDKDRFHAIMEEVAKKYKLTKYQKQHELAWLALGSGPSYTPEFANNEDRAKWNRTMDKVNAGEEVLISDLWLTKQAAECCRKLPTTEEELSAIDILILYEYNRRSQPETAKKYYEILKTRKK